MKKHADYYSEEELAVLKEKWQKEKERIEADWIRYGYYHDRDTEYEWCLDNKNLQKLFRHAAYLKRHIMENTITLNSSMKAFIENVYGRIIENGYYSESKKEEKRVRNIFANIVSGYNYGKLKRR